MAVKLIPSLPIFSTRCFMAWLILVDDSMTLVHGGFPANGRRNHLHPKRGIIPQNFRLFDIGDLEELRNKKIYNKNHCLTSYCFKVSIVNSFYFLFHYLCEHYYHTCALINKLNHFICFVWNLYRRSIKKGAKT